MTSWKGFIMNILCLNNCNHFTDRFSDKPYIVFLLLAFTDNILTIQWKIDSGTLRYRLNVDYYIIYHKCIFSGSVKKIHEIYIIKQLIIHTLARKYPQDMFSFVKDVCARIDTGNSYCSYCQYKCFEACHESTVCKNCPNWMPFTSAKSPKNHRPVYDQYIPLIGYIFTDAQTLNSV